MRNGCTESIMAWLAMSFEMVGLVAGMMVGSSADGLENISGAGGYLNCLMDYGSWTRSELFSRQLNEGANPDLKTNLEDVRTMKEPMYVQSPGGVKEEKVNLVTRDIWQFIMLGGSEDFSQNGFFMTILWRCPCVYDSVGSCAIDAERLQIVKAMQWAVGSLLAVKEALETDYLSFKSWAATQCDRDWPIDCGLVKIGSASDADLIKEVDVYLQRLLSIFERQSVVYKAICNKSEFMTSIRKLKEWKEISYQIMRNISFDKCKQQQLRHFLFAYLRHQAYLKQLIELVDSPLGRYYRLSISSNLRQCIGSVLRFDLMAYLSCDRDDQDILNEHLILDYELEQHYKYNNWWSLITQKTKAVLKPLQRITLQTTKDNTTLTQEEINALLEFIGTAKNHVQINLNVKIQTVSVFKNQYNLIRAKPKTTLKSCLNGLKNQKYLHNLAPTKFTAGLVLPLFIIFLCQILF
ncbi:hypothetical protein NEHOM01_0212 [Nematocida homosporus]|uniref:uncharacterized protein n=1 Tax=Nematocida homosporus TaxID=1912981 RepID=UPI00221F0A58|nr:uncharacterized protein NEHOM01_0212 [Nematocida homosporus]KAI5184537.1 hypothetical protein NEHOM01_0212 [Nematocida homosporus]